MSETQANLGNGQMNTSPTKVQRPKRFTFVKQLFREPKAVVGFSIIGIFVVLSVFAPLIAQHNPSSVNQAAMMQPPNASYWFGTNNEGQDLFSQWLYGTRTTMLIGLGVACIGTFLSVVIGIYGGYKGGRTDAVLSWITQVMLVLPGYPLTLVIISYIPNAGAQAIVWILGLTGWAPAARMKRAQAQTYRSRDFVLAARLGGLSDLYIMFSEVLPNMLSLVFNTFISLMAGGIFGEAFLRFLGIGSSAQPSLGNMLNAAQNGDALMYGAWWWFIPPGATITLFLLALTLINYGVDTVSNPRLVSPPKLPKDLRRKLASIGGGTST